MRRRFNIAALAGTIKKHRILWLFAAVFIVMGLTAPKFLTENNIFSMLKTSSPYAITAIGFTIVLICGQLDLSFGSVMTLAGMLAIGLQPKLGWSLSITAGILAGDVCGLVNGLLVAKAKVNSFIATLGMMVIVQGVVNIYSKGGTLFVENFSFGDWLNSPVVSFLCPVVLIALVLVLAFDAFLRRTRVGRSIFMIGGNADTAWYAGLNTSGYVIGSFVMAGVLSALSGTLFAAGLSSANPTMGNQSLMLIISAVIVGGTSMAGGKGSVLSSWVAILTLVALVNGLSCIGAGFEVLQIASGLVLALVVLWDAYVLHKQKQRRGQRPDLLAEIRK